MLGALLLDKDQIGVVVGKLEADDFYLAAHADVFRAMLHLFSHGTPIDTLTLADELERQGSLGRVGGLEVLTSLAASVPTAANLEYYAKIVLDHSLKRRLISTAGRLADLGFDDSLEADEAVEEARRTVSQMAGGQRGSGFQVVRVCDVPETPPPPDLIDGLFPDHFPSSVHGDGGHLKSYLVLCALICVAAGVPFLGLAVTKAPTLFIDYELNDEVTARRARQLCRGLGLPGVPRDLFYVNARKPLLRLIPEIEATVATHGIRLAGIDSLGLAIAGDTQSEDGVILVMSALRALGIATVAVDHQARLQAGEEYANKQQFGSVYKSNLSRSVLQVERAAQGIDPSVVDLMMRQKKASFGPDRPPLGIRVTFGADSVTITAQDAASSPVLASKLPAKDRVLAQLVSEPGNTSETLAELSGIELKTVKNALSELNQLGQVKLSPGRKPREPGTWCPTPAGEERVSHPGSRPDSHPDDLDRDVKFRVPDVGVPPLGLPLDTVGMRNAGPVEGGLGIPTSLTGRDARPPSSRNGLPTEVGGEGVSLPAESGPPDPRTGVGAGSAPKQRRSRPAGPCH